MSGSDQEELKKHVQAWADREIDRVGEQLRARGWSFVAIVLARLVEYSADEVGAPIARRWHSPRRAWGAETEGPTRITRR